MLVSLNSILRFSGLSEKLGLSERGGSAGAGGQNPTMSIAISLNRDLVSVESHVNSITIGHVLVA